jgi:hypothetical protein
MVVLVMSRIGIATLVLCALSISNATALERIKRGPESVAEAERIASEQPMSNTTLQKGDIVSTNQDFFVYRGSATDGQSGGFARVANPFLKRSKRPDG